METITEFKEQYRFLSNFYQQPFSYQGLTYPNAEAAFQAQKCASEEEKVKYTTIKNPVVAKRMGKKEPNLPADWDERGTDIMEGILRAKFSISELAEKLLDTGDKVLIEGNHWHDNRWGHCTCARCAEKPYENRLGAILMRIREELRGGGEK